jgi:CRP-like cAMP-binding protein
VLPGGQGRKQATAIPAAVQVAFFSHALLADLGEVAHRLADLTQPMLAFDNAEPAANSGSNAWETILPNSSFRTAGNRLIDCLPELQRIRLLAECREVELKFGQRLGMPGDTIKQVYFPLTAFISRLTPVPRHPSLEVGLVGHEGMLGETLWLGLDRHPTQVLVQGSGTALEISAEAFRRELRHSPMLGQIVARYMFVLIEQLAQNSVCHAFHELRERLVRWLLMTHDRAPGDRLELTHQFLSDMLGVRRSAVTIAASDLQLRGLIRYARGRIRILSRPGLEAITCECYAASLAAVVRSLSGRPTSLSRRLMIFDARSV